MVIKRKVLLHEISNLAYVVADVCEGKESPHALHQIYDICEEGNIDRVGSLLALAAAEVGHAISSLAVMNKRKDDYHLKFTGCSKEAAIKITRLTREYMVTSVMHGWLAMTLPSLANFWDMRKENLLLILDTTIERAIASRHATLRRKLSPF